MKLDERLIHQIVEAVVKRLSEGGDAPGEAQEPSPVAREKPRVTDGVFRDMEEAIQAASEAQKALMAQPLAVRERVVQAVRDVGTARGPEYARREFEETGLGNPGDNLAKITASCRVPGMEDLAPEVYTGDLGVTIVERIPYGVIASVNPVTNGVPTILFNGIMMLAGGNTVINNPHPKTRLVCADAVRDLNAAIQGAGGPPNCICCLEEPSVASAQHLMTHPGIPLIAVTGGHGVVQFARGTGKRVIAGGPGNPPVVVDETADLDLAARCIVEGASFCNCMPCASEKEIFVVDAVADALKGHLGRYGAHEISRERGEALMAHIFKETRGPGRPGVINMDFIGKPPSFILKAIGLEVGPEVKIVILETDRDHPLVWTEQIMPVLPLVRCRDAGEAIRLGVAAEQGLGHTIVMHSRDLRNLGLMAGMADACAFVKNGSSLAGVGVKGEGYTSFHIATDGEGHTRPRMFTRIRRCAISNDFRLRFGASQEDRPG